jgi:hypothetical protein
MILEFSFEISRKNVSGNTKRGIFYDTYHPKRLWQRGGSEPFCGYVLRLPKGSLWFMLIRGRKDTDWIHGKNAKWWRERYEGEYELRQLNMAYYEGEIERLKDETGKTSTSGT